MFNFIKLAYKSLAEKEKKFIWLIILLTLFITSLPVIYIWLTTPSDLHYTGFTVIAGADKTVYLSQMEEARQGHILFHNLYTGEAKAARIFSPVWLLLGWLAKLTTLSNVLVFQLARVATGALFLWLIYVFISRIFSQINWRKTAFLIICFGSGLGVFFLNNPWSPDNIYNTFGTDMWVSEGNTFLTLYHSPLFILSQAFLLLIFWWLIERLKSSRFPEVVLMGLISLVLGIFHPYDLVTVYAVSGIWLICESIRERKILGRQIFKLAVINLIAFAAIFYFWWLNQSDPSFAGWAKQNITLSPRLFNYFVGYGLVFIFYLFGIYRAIKNSSAYWRFLAIWSIVGWFLLFIPIQFQRRLANGLHLPLSLIAVLGFISVLVYLNKSEIIKKLLRKYSWRAFSASFLFLLLASSTLYNFGQDVVFLSLRPYPYFLSNGQKETMDWIKNNINQGEVILSEAKTGNLIPSFTARQVYLGHGHQTGDWIGKLIKVRAWFYFNNFDDQRKHQWLKDQKIQFVYYGAEEKAVGNFQPAQKSYLRPVYQNQDVIIYKVI